MISATSGKMMNQYARSPFEASCTYCVSIGSSPPSWSKIFTKTGTRNISIPTRTSVANVSTTVG